MRVEERECGDADEQIEFGGEKPAAEAEIETEDAGEGDEDATCVDEKCAAAHGEVRDGHGGRRMSERVGGFEGRTQSGGEIGFWWTRNVYDELLVDARLARIARFGIGRFGRGFSLGFGMLQLGEARGGAGESGLKRIV